MFWASVKRVIKAGLMNFVRNGAVTFATVLVMTVTLFTVGLTIFMLSALSVALGDIRDKVDVNVYFVTSAPEAEIFTVKKNIELLPEVKSVTYVSREEVLERFKKRHEGDELILQALKELEENPLRAILTVRAKDPSQYESIATLLKGESFLSKETRAIIDNVDFYDNKKAIDRLTRLITSAGKLGFGVTFLLVVLSVIIAFTTIRLTIYIAREEISVMRLVGAGNGYIRSPFVVTGLLYGVISGLLTLAIFYPVTLWLGPFTTSFFGGFNVFRYYGEHFGDLFGIIVGSGIVLGGVSSYLAVRKYLKV